MRRECFERLERITWFRGNILEKKSVILVGAGALGNWILPHLVLNGVGHVLIIDRDRIEECNLPVSPLFSPADIGKPKARVAADRLQEMAPDASIDSIIGDVRWDVGLAHFRHTDIVIGAVDSRIARQAVNRKAFLTIRPYIDSGIDGQSLTGRIQVFVPQRGPCLECSWYPKDYALIEREYPCTEAEPDGLGVPTTSTIAAAIASLAANETLKVLMDVSERLEPGSELRWDLLHNTRTLTEIPRRLSCPFDHESFIENTIILPDSAEDITLGRLFESASHHLREEATLDFLGDLVTSLVCEKCREEKPTLRMLGKLNTRDRQCHCSGRRHPRNIVHEIRRSDWNAKCFLDCSLSETGLPSAEIIRAHTSRPGSEIYLELAGAMTKKLRSACEQDTESQAV